MRAMDILFPWIGEIIGGSQQEEQLEVLQNRMREMRAGIRAVVVPRHAQVRHLCTRRLRTRFRAPDAFVTGMTNIRDVIPFPRTPKNAGSDPGKAKRKPRLVWDTSRGFLQELHAPENESLTSRFYSAGSRRSPLIHSGPD